MRRREIRQFVRELIDSFEKDCWEFGETYDHPSLSTDNLVVCWDQGVYNIEVFIATDNQPTQIWLPLFQNLRLRRAIRNNLIKRASKLIPNNSET